MSKINNFVLSATLILGIILVQLLNGGLEGYASRAHTMSVPVNPAPNNNPVDQDLKPKVTEIVEEMKIDPVIEPSTTTTTELKPTEAPETSESKKDDTKEKLPANESPSTYDEKTHEFLKSKADNEFIIVAAANNGHRDFVRNWVEGMKRNIENDGQYVIVCLDKEIYGYLQSINVPSLPITSIVRDQVVTDSYEKGDLLGEKLFATKDYYKLTNIKIEVVKSILETYKMPVIFSDVDLVWINPKISTYPKHLIKTGNFDFVYSLDLCSVQEIVVNTGFMLFGQLTLRSTSWQR